MRGGINRQPVLNPMAEFDRFGVCPDSFALVGEAKDHRKGKGVVHG